MICPTCIVRVNSQVHVMHETFAEARVYLINYILASN